MAGAPDSMSKAVVRRKYPIVGDGTGVMPFIHLDDATSATVLALEHEGSAAPIRSEFRREIFSRY